MYVYRDICIVLRGRHVRRLGGSGLHICMYTEIDVYMYVYVYVYIKRYIYSTTLKTGQAIGWLRFANMYTYRCMYIYVYAYACMYVYRDI